MVGNQRQGARKFREYWAFQRGSEKGEDQQFWNSLLRDVLGVADIERHIQYQVPVPMAGTTKFLDAWIPETRVLIEHKSRGVKLDAPQVGHGSKTPFQQALEYNQARGFSEKARWIVTCNFDEIWVYDMDQPLSDPQKIRIADLPKEISRLGFLIDATVKSVREREKDISIKAGRIVGELYKALLKRYAEPDSPETLKALNRLCVRLVFVFYAEDADIFPKDAFWNLLKETPAKFLRKRLIDLFLTLDASLSTRDPYLESELAVFPYTNGGLFRGVLDADIPPIDEEIKELLIRSSDFDWRDISPTIFGALFESTLNPVTRRAGGMVYTSVENIHKVIDPLFLDDLTRRVDELVGRGVLDAPTRRALLALQAEMASLTFLDPACGSGNFLTETYICLRRLENRIIAALQNGQGEFDLGTSVRVSIAQFYGIEINDFAVAVAKTALWIAEAQMLRETAEILHREPDYLPLRDYANIVEGNALRLDWGELISRGDAEPRRFDYIMGNPPFVGASMMTAEQKAEAVAIFGKGKRVNSIDYVGAWYYKAAELLAANDAKITKVAFVSTNSITQGEQVAPLWRKLFEKYGVELDFAWRTFIWNSDSFEKAHVHCVIVGFHRNGQGTRRTTATEGTGGKTSSASRGSLSSLSAPKTIFDNGKAIPASHINAYLIDAPDAFAEPRPKPICTVPLMTYGNKPSDGGNLILSEDERNAILSATPALAPHIRRYVGAQDFINNDKVRYCLWLRDVSPSIYRANSEVMCRLAAVREMRLASSAAPTRAMANTPYLFFSAPQTEDDYLLVPEVSSERREYVPMGFLTNETIAANTVSIVPNATLYHFGVLTSSVHMAWMRVVAGRLKSDYRYSAAIVYNNFPWPNLEGSGKSAASPNERQPVGEAALSPLHVALEATAPRILDIRARYPESSLADLYDPLTMPPDLRAAHAANDRAVLAAYGLAPDTPEPEIIAHLFGLYANAIKKKECK